MLKQYSITEKKTIIFYTCVSFVIEFLVPIVLIYFRQLNVLAIYLLALIPAYIYKTVRDYNLKNKGILIFIHLCITLLLNLSWLYSVLCGVFAYYGALHSQVEKR